jgi:hypothetical protein
MKTTAQTSSDLLVEPRTGHGCGRAIALAVLTAAAAGCSSMGPAGIGQATDRLDQTVLGTALGFAVLGGSTVTNTGSTTIGGDLGVTPGLAVTGFPPGLVTGAVHAGDAVALAAQDDSQIAFDALAGETLTVDLTGQDLGGMTLTPGVYRFSSSAQLTGALTLDAGGDPGAVFVFQIGSTLTTATSSAIVLIDGAGDCNTFWQVGTSATLGTTSVFKGSILALTSITLNTGAAVSGRVLARNGAVTLDSNAVSLPLCEAPGETPDAGAPEGDAGGAPDADAPEVDAGTPEAGPSTT